MKCRSNRSISFLRIILITLGCTFMTTKANVIKPQLKPRLVLQPLIGGPSWLKVHVQVHLVELDDNGDNRIKNPIRHKFDFVPLNPSDPRTLARLLTLQSVPGEIRTFQSTHQPSLRFCQQYNNNELHLIFNNCWIFAAKLYWYLLQQQEEKIEDANSFEKTKQ
ncbi:hypothetical protein FisN_4Hh301 [Fistulifera solaris]|uniref:Uncharacterized protein n=1 Tax=Fistulifera solaris TaxID=1519565 RepID=A0A1Z5KEN5_FISSO|nr:hypothetical protein FisN_4Hh301 [Fistulifera solaris]|eukprot:GAX24743.1 hypothetical protein FisN_4Hh301 [Fistulifera solaris]